MAWYDVDLRTVNLIDILEGCTDYILEQNNLLTDLQKIEVAAFRQKKCDSCPQNLNGWCDADPKKKLVKHRETGKMVTGCGCNIKCKKFILHAECPAKIWRSVKLQ